MYIGTYSCVYLLFSNVLFSVGGYKRIHGRYDKQGQEGRYQHSAYYRYTHGDTPLGTLARSVYQWHQTEDGGYASHQDRAQTLGRGRSDRFRQTKSRLLPLIGELYDQDTVLRHQTNQHNDTDLAEYIHRDTRITHEH